MRIERVLAVGVVVAAAVIMGTPRSGWAQNGVRVDAEGVLRVQSHTDPGGRLHRQRVVAARAALDQQLARKSPLRKVSINRLEAALLDALENNRQPTQAMRYLAGLTRVQYVFYYPDTGDIVLAGPAEGWVRDLSGRLVGIDSGRPILELQDLIVALRTFAPAGPDAPVLSVSIDPTPEGLRNMQGFLNNLRGITPADAPRIAEGLRTSLGLQDVVVRGISPNTHFAEVLVEADYRMKLIGIGLERPPVKIVSYISKANPSSVARNALKRWYFVPNYECVKVAEDGQAMEMVGNGVQLIGEDQLVAADGTRRVGGQYDRASTLFTQSFTRMYPQLAAKSPVYAQMRNLIDLAIAAAFVRQQGYYDKSGWQMKVFLDEKAYPVETLITPQHVETAVNVVWRGNVLMTPVGGGVRIEAAQALATDNLLTDSKGEVSKAREAIQPDRVDHDRWWWD